MSKVDTRRNYGPAHEKLRLERKNKKVPNAGKEMTQTGVVTNMATSRDGAQYVTLRVKEGTGKRYARIKEIFSDGASMKMQRNMDDSLPENSAPKRSKSKKK